MASAAPLPTITVTTPLRHPRLKYVLRIVGEDLGYRFRFFNDRSVFGQEAPRYSIHYGNGEGPRCLPAHPLLSGKAPAPACTAPLLHDGLPVFFMTEHGPDLLACIFFALSRYEEYGSFQPDAHGRFPATQSHAHRHGYLMRPMVREWTAALGRQLRRWFPNLPPPRKHPLRFVPTYDIDLLWAYRHRGIRGIASGVKDLLTGKPKRSLQRLTTRSATDPYFTIPALEALHQQHNLVARYFWLLSNGKLRQDPNPYPIPPEQRRLMRDLPQVGLHPSYASSEHPELIAQERQRMEQIVDRPVTHSRQHFLRFRLPDTYRSLIKAGITNDYSMGYADAPGWRAGTNLPFPWYDLEQERETKLTVHPFAAMDATLRSYQNKGAEAAGATIREMEQSLREYGGAFSLLWHNSSFAEAYGWDGWWGMYTKLVAELATGDQTSSSPPDSGRH